MSTEFSTRPATSRTTYDRPWANGYAVFAVAAMVVLGVWQVLAGVAAVVRDGTYDAGIAYTRTIDLAWWGWTLVLLGVLTAWAGVAVLRGRLGGSVAAVLLTQLSMLVNFALIPSHPLFSMVIIGLNIAVLWALRAYHGAGTPAARRRADDRAREPRRNR